MSESKQSGPAAAEASALAKSWSRLAPWQVAGIVALLLYIPWLGQRDLWFPDEPDVAEPAMTMYKSGDWVVPRRNDEPWLDYPPLVYWIGATSSHLFGGPSPFALRLPVALIAVFLVGLTALAGERLAGRQAGLCAGLGLATTPQFAYEAVNYHPDMIFAALVASGLAAYGWGVTQRTGWRTVAWRIFGFACFGGAILAKGPLGLLLPGLILVVWHASLKQWRPLLWLAPLSLVSLVMAAPWYLLLVRAATGEYVWQEIYLQNFARFKGGPRGHARPWSYYLLAIWFTLAPWSLFLPSALTTAFKRDWRRPLTRLALLCFLVSLAFLSAATTKRQVYLLPAYPAIAFLIGRELALLTDTPRRTRLRWSVAGIGAASLLAGVALPLVSILGGTLDLRRPQLIRAMSVAHDLAIPLAVLCAGVTLAGICLLRMSREGVSTLAFGSVVALICFVYLAVQIAVLPRLDDEKSYRAAAIWLRKQCGDEAIGYYPPGTDYKTAGFRVHDPAYMPLERVNSSEEAAAFLASGPRVLLLNVEYTEVIASAVSDWEDLPKRELALSSHRFLAVGPQTVVADQ